MRWRSTADNGELLIRSLRQLGRLRQAEYFDGEPERPRVFDLLDAAGETPV
jgi:hypothetical protein